MTVGDSKSCPTPPNKDFGWPCILEFPEFGYVAVNSQGYESNETFINVVLAPRQGVEVRWLGTEIVLVDLGNNTVLQKQEIDGKPVVGGDMGGQFNDYHLVGYGRSITTHFDVKPTVEHMELRFPPVLVGDKQVEVPPIQLREKTRVPVPVPPFLRVGH